VRAGVARVRLLASCLLARLSQQASQWPRLRSYLTFNGENQKRLPVEKVEILL
jgi:hypothetical protein